MTKHRKRHTINGTEDFGISATLLTPLKFALLFLILGLVIVMIASLLLFNTSNPSEYLEYIGKGCLYVSVFITSLALGKKHQSKNVLFGTLLGAYIVALLVTISVFLPSNSFKNNILWLILIPPVSILGCFLGGKINNPLKRKKRRYK